MTCRWRLWYWVIDIAMYNILVGESYKDSSFSTVTVISALSIGYPGYTSSSDSAFFEQNALRCRGYERAWALKVLSLSVECVNELRGSTLCLSSACQGLACGENDHGSCSTRLWLRRRLTLAAAIIAARLVNIHWVSICSSGFQVGLLDCVVEVLLCLVD